MRATRLLVLAVLASTGCPDRTISAVPVDQGKVEVKDIPAIPKRDIDILFMIDDSPSMQDEQESLKANFPRMVDVLNSIDGGLPDVQIGVITPNLGTSALDGTQAAPIGGCSGRGDDGVLRQRDGMTGPRFLRDVDDHAGGRQRNYTGTLADAFSDFASVGITGCGIEQHLGAIERATDGSKPENAGFLRDDAYLAVIVIADEDDCSLQKSSLFDANPRLGAGYGEKTNFRCTSQGVVCDTPSTDFEAATGPREDCHPRADITEVAAVDRYADHIKSLKHNPRDIVVAGIVGDPTNFEIVKDGGFTGLANACPGGGTTKVAFPAVRTDNFLEQFPLRTRSTICATDLSQNLVEIGALIKAVIVEPCFDNDLLDVDPATPGPQYDCSVTEVRRRPGFDDEELDVLPACSSGQFPCWRIEEDAVKCSYTNADPHLKLVVDRGAVPADPDLHVKASCVTTDASGPVL